MDASVKFEGKNHKVFITNTPFGSYPLIVVERRYGNDSLALEALSCRKFNDGHYEIEDSFGIITVNLGCQSKLCQFVKNYGENSGWAEELAKAIGGKDTGLTQQTGFVTVPFYDFSEMKIYCEDELLSDKEMGSDT